MVDHLGIGGAQKVVLDICSSADLEKYDVSIFTLRGASELREAYDLDSRIKIHFFDLDLDPDFSFSSYLKRALHPGTSLPAMKPLIDAVAEGNPDILHVHLVPRDLNLGILVQQKTDCTLLYTQHLSNFRSDTFVTKLMGPILRRTYRKYHLIAVSTSVEEEIVRHKLVGADKKLVVIPNKLNLDLYRPVERVGSEPIRVVYVARIGFPKGHDDLLQAWRLLIGEPPAKSLILVGPDAMDGEMQRLADKLGLLSSIEFLGARHDVAEILSQSDIGVFPSLQEGLPLALLEKMAMELPVVVSDIPQLTAIVSDGENGLTFKRGNAEDLADKIRLLIGDSRLRRELGRNARRTVEESYGSHNIAEPTEEVYELIRPPGE